jgi:hypothetical protein
VTDQELVRNNLALALSCQQGLPVRVIRGSDPGNPFAPQEGYRYDGLFRVEEYWRETAEAGLPCGGSGCGKLIRSKGMKDGRIGNRCR